MVRAKIKAKAKEAANQNNPKRFPPLHILSLPYPYTLGSSIGPQTPTNTLYRTGPSIYGPSGVRLNFLYSPLPLFLPNPTLWAVHLGPSGVPIPVHSSPSLPPSPLQSITAPGRPFRAVRSGRFSTHPPTSPNPLSLHLDTLRAVHLGPSGVFAIVTLPTSLPNPTKLVTPCQQPLVIALGRPFRAVRSVCLNFLPPSKTPSKPVIAQGRPFRTILRENNRNSLQLHFLPTPSWSSLWAVHLGPSGVAVPVLLTTRERKKKGGGPSPSSPRL